MKLPAICTIVIVLHVGCSENPENKATDANLENKATDANLENKTADNKTSSAGEWVARDETATKDEYSPLGRATDEIVVAQIADGATFDGVNLSMHDAITDKSIVHIVDKLPNLRSLMLESEHVTDESLKHIGQLKDLEILYIGESQITDAGLAHIADLTKLRELGLYSDALTAAGAKHLEKLTNVEMFDSNIIELLDDEVLSHLRGWTNLKSLELIIHEGEITDAGMAFLAEMKGLEDLYLKCEHVTDAGLAHLATLPRVKELTLYGFDQITDKGIEHLAQMSTLEELKVLYCSNEISGPGLAALKELSNLRSFGSRNITNDGLQYIGQLTQLERLDLAECSIDDAGVSHLSGLTNLKELGISYTGVTDACLVHLHNLKNLETLMNITAGTDVTDEAVAELAKVLPKLEE